MTSDRTLPGWPLRVAIWVAVRFVEGVRLAPLGRVSVEEAQEAFVEQIEALVTAEPQGVDLLIIETMSDIKEVATAVAAAVVTR